MRRADLKLGEFGVVVGVGILGLLTIQMLKGSGVRPAAIDVDDDRLKKAKELGAEMIINPQRDESVKTIVNWSNGYGADAVIFTASTESSEPLSLSFQMCKKKGRVILVGASGMEIKRGDMYPKELDFLISTSYGPGRYDSEYEHKGMTYPYGYVRWTETRNMQEYLRLVGSDSIKLDKIIDMTFSVAEITKAFEALNAQENKPLMVLLDYGQPELEKLGEYLLHDRKIHINHRPINKDLINIALVGVGKFAVSTRIPSIKKLSDSYRIHAIVNQHGYAGKTVAQDVGASYVTTNFRDVLEDDAVDLVLICTRHDSHGKLVVDALKARKHVFVEKPLATSLEDLDKIKDIYSAGLEDKPLLVVGFNRRFSPGAAEIKRHTKNRINPLFIQYRMNAGYIPSDHWVHENKGRIVGEACHIIDLMTFFTESKIESLSHEQLRPQNNRYSSSDNISFILKYEDGSVAAVQYFAVGNRTFSKEYMEVHFDDKTIVLDDYQSLRGYGVKINEITTATDQKGHLEQMVSVLDNLKGKNSEWPIQFWDMIQTTAVTLSLASL